jgi:uncharacterized OB-fold protein
MTYQKPLPQPSADDKFFWDGCKEHKLLFQKCKICGLVRWPPSIICANCYSRDTEVIESTGRGRIYSFAVFRQAFHPGFENEVPYITAVIELEEGPHFLSNIINCEPAEVQCDMPVSVVWENATPELSLPKFKLIK